jgi:prepilin-type processing-associated H-X9-DG protein
MYEASSSRGQKRCGQNMRSTGRISARSMWRLIVLLISGTIVNSAPGPTVEGAGDIPPAWKILPIPRDADYGGESEFIKMQQVAVVRHEGGPYQTIRGEDSELQRNSTIIEEELLQLLEEWHVEDVKCLSDDLPAYADYDTLILLGSPRHNRQTARHFDAMKLSFEAWDDPRTPQDDFEDWNDFGAEGYLLKVGRLAGQNIIILAGYDFDVEGECFHGAGTFYALQSLRQLVICDRDSARVKTAEVADSPLLRIRGCMTGFEPSEEKQWRDIRFLPQIKANQNVYWYGNSLGSYNSQAAGKFRYPWTPEQLALFARFGKYCRERYVATVFCMNPDHFHVDWAAAKTFDGSRKDPLHYAPDYQVEPEFRQMWAELGYAVENDIDILAAKFCQLHRVIPGAMLQMMNEDDGFGLFNPRDQELFQTKTGDPRQDAINYGHARGKLLVALYNKIQELCPDSPAYLPVCPPGQLAYQWVLERDEANSREFLASLGATLQEAGLQRRMPLLTTGGGTAAEVITGPQIDRFQRWSNGCPVLLHDNNFAVCSKVGAYETDPQGARSLHQINEELPAGYRDPQLYQRLWGIHWNGVPDQVVLGWCQSQFMWNMLALDRQQVNLLATRKVSSESSYPLVRSYLEEFDNPASYLPDNQPPVRVKVISDRVAFPAEGWQYLFRFTHFQRQECQRLREKLRALLPRLETEWENAVEKRASLDQLGYSAYSFATVYLAYGYLRGWEDSPDAASENLYTGDALRDLFLEADDLQELYFAGPDVVDGKRPINRSSYSGTLNYLYADGHPFKVPATPEEADCYMDIWQKGLDGNYFQQLETVSLGQLPDSDPRLASGWGPATGATGASEQHRTVTSEARLALEPTSHRSLLVRMRLGTETTDRSQATEFCVTTGDREFRGVVCQPRWFHWLLPKGASIANLRFEASAPINVYQVTVLCVQERVQQTEPTGSRRRAKPMVSGNLRGYRDWSRDRWKRELEAEKAIGFDLLWLSHLDLEEESQLGNSDESHEPTDKIRMVLDLCQQLDMQVILSTGSSRQWFGTLDLEKEIQLVGSRIQRIGERYRNHPAFFAWYIPHEIYFADGPFGAYIEKLFPALVERCKAAAPGKPVTLSPFFILDQDRIFGDFRYVTPEEYREYWTHLIQLSGFDIIMLQDSGEHFSYVTNEQRRPFFAAMHAACEASDARFWANVEVAEMVCPSIEEYVQRYGRVHHAIAKDIPWRAVPMDRLESKLELAAEYAERIVSWGYVQFGRPSLGAEAANWYQQYQQYQQYYHRVDKDR